MNVLLSFLSPVHLRREVIEHLVSIQSQPTTLGKVTLLWDKRAFFREEPLAHINY